ncbi:MAG TPA: flagellar hook capping FlgD N-terminal domain-containing protein [Pirellulaceae bacterium]|nr:flagellar hook capping FlgD N-terminal domain-containing protein [Pirellulaceae bacterium]
MQSSFDSSIAKTEFLQLLTIQLRNQDPLDPVKQENFIGQLAQFSTLEGIENLNTSFRSMLRLQEISQGVNLVGKNVDYADLASGEIKSGRVDEFFVEQGVIMLMIQGRAVSIELIAGVKAE